MMKKLLAVLLALVLALGCTAALAEEEQSQALLSMVDLTLDADFVKAYAGMMDAEGDNTYATLAATALDVLDQLHLYVLCSAETGTAVLGTADSDLATFDYVADEEGLTLVSNLFPHYALRVTTEELEQLAKQVTSSMNVTLNGKELTQEDAQAVLNALTPYLEDLSGWIGGLTERMEMSEDGNTVTLTLTTHDAADALEIIAARLRTDEVLLPYVQAGVDQANAEEGTEVTLEEAFAKLDQQVADWRAAEPQVLATAEITMTETGVAARVYNDAGELTFEYGQNENGIFADLALNAGETAATLNVLVQADETATMVQLVLNVQAEDMTIALTAVDALSGEGTEDFNNYFALGVNPGLTDCNIAVIEVSTVYAPVPEKPSLEGLTVLDPMTMTEEEQNALVQDLTGNGLPALLAAAQQALPDQLATVMNLMGGEQ